jgi:hypothetical protein
MSAWERQDVLSMVDRNGRTPLILAAMIGDVEFLQLLWDHGADIYNASVSRDTGGFTALMRGVQLGHSGAVAWLVGVAEAKLTPSDVATLDSLGGLGGAAPVAHYNATEAAPAYLGRGGITWTHPDSAHFVTLPDVIPDPTHAPTSAPTAPTSSPTVTPTTTVADTNDTNDTVTASSPSGNDSDNATNDVVQEFSAEMVNEDRQDSNESNESNGSINESIFAFNST